MDINNKTLIITGAARGLGRVMATHLASLGAQVALIDLDAPALEQTCETILSSGGKAAAYTCNVAKEDDVKTTIKQVSDDFWSHSWPG